MSNAEQPPTPPTPPSETEVKLSRASVGRFSLYLRHAQRLAGEGVRTVSSSQLGEALGLTDAQVRKDLAYLGNLGHRGVGYPTLELITALRSVLGVNRTWEVLLVGVGNLARALLRYRGFQQQGFHIAALFDGDPAKVGAVIDGLAVRPMEELPAFVADTGVRLAILTVPAEVAQEVADRLAAAGIRGLLNFAPAVLRLPPSVQLVTVDLAIQLEQLAFLTNLGAGTNGCH